jgi:hypothetical protein
LALAVLAVQLKQRKAQAVQIVFLGLLLLQGAAQEELLLEVILL